MVLRCFLPVLGIFFLFQSSCAAFVSPGFFFPTNSELKESVGSVWPAMEFGAVVENTAPLLVRCGLGFSGSSDSEETAVYDLTAEANYITFRAAAMYLVPGTGERRFDGFYLGGGLVVLTWSGGVKGTILGLPVDDTDSNSDAGVLLVAGYRYMLEPHGIGLFAEILFESVKSTSEELEEQIGSQLGGITLVLGLYF